MTQRERLLQQIQNLEALVQTQRSKYDLATKCLGDTKATIAVSKIAARVDGEPLSAREIIEFGNAIRNSVQVIMDAATSLGEMRRELQTLRDTLLMLPE